MGALDDDERRELRRKADHATLEALRALGGEARRDAIRERALADGGFTPRELAAAPPQAAGEKFDRLVDHQLAWALTNLKRSGRVENPKWGTWRLAGPELRVSALRSMPYRKYLRTPEWRRTRAEALERAGHCCSLDVTHTEHLEVHHRTYERLGTELPSDLIVLCRACHRLHHDANGRPRRVTTSESPGLPLLRRLLPR